jgi:hypothetical protein
MDKYKIMARLDFGDKWQEFTGSKKTSLQDIVDHCYIHFRGLPYQFGIFRLVKAISEKGKNVMRWKKEKIINKIPCLSHNE